MANKTFTFNSDNIKSYDTERIIRLYKFAYGEEATERFFNVYEEREAMTMSLLGWAQRIGAAVVAALLGVSPEGVTPQMKIGAKLVAALLGVNVNVQSNAIIVDEVEVAADKKESMFMVMLMKHSKMFQQFNAAMTQPHSKINYRQARELQLMKKSLSWSEMVECYADFGWSHNLIRNVVKSRVQPDFLMDEYIAFRTIKFGSKQEITLKGQVDNQWWDEFQG